MRLNSLNKFKFILLILLILSFSSLSLKAFYYQNADGVPSVLVLGDSKDISSNELTDQVKAIFRYTNFENVFFDLNSSSDFEIPIGTKLIINSTDSIAKLEPDQIEKLVRFIASGGNMIFLGAVTEENMAFIQGIKSNSDFTFELNVRGTKAIEPIFPGFSEKAYYTPTNVPHDGLKAENFNQKIRVLATSYTDESYPVLLEHTIGSGKVIVFNTGILFEKKYRGLVFSTMLKLLPNLPYRVANVGTMFLDDFPAPLYNTKLEPIESEYDVEQAEFVYDIWWPDMKAYADSVFMTYSAMIAFNYNANIVPPFDFQEWESARLRRGGKEIKPSIELSRDILKTRHELAFHGYNHFSLNNDEWSYQKDFMVSALKAVEKRWRIDDLGAYPVSYVPPTNYIDSTGIQALVRGLPSIEIMSSLYLGDIPDGGGREFGPDPYNSKLFDYPRSTSGFTMQENSLFDQSSMQLLTGVWNHFVHPDDVFQIVQRDADAFESRNPDGLGWMSTDGKPGGLYHEMRKRIKYTRKNFPFLRLVSADFGAEVAKDWLATSTSYSENRNNYIAQVTPPNRYESNTPNKDEKHWFMYVKEADKRSIEDHLNTFAEGYSFSKYWDGYLFQFYSKRNVFFIPKSRTNETTSGESIAQLMTAALNDYTTSLRIQEEQDDEEENSEPVITPEEQLLTAINLYLKNPKNLKLQEDVIALSIENDQNMRAIQVLEFRLKSTPVWRENDLQRLVTFYGYESAFQRAENFLEELWRKYGDEKVILLKDRVALNLGLFDPEFVNRWRLREINIYGRSVERVLAYTSSIESQETWPEVKKNLLNLIDDNPQSDSLYAYIIQRSFFYEPSDSTITLLESFPGWTHNQLNPFASQFANIYGYEILDYEKALYWAERTDQISDRAKLGWIAEKEDFNQFEIKTREYLSKKGSPDSLRTYAGTVLFYNGKRDVGYEILYPLFDDGLTNQQEAQSLIDTELGFLGYDERKNLYREYPEFFRLNARMRLMTDRRWNEGVRASLFGEYFSDNFDNKSARGGVSVQFGNRRNKTHLFKLEDIYINDLVGTENVFSNFTGLGYEFEKRKQDFSRVFRFGPSLFYGSEGILGEAFVSYSISYDSTFTSLNLSFEPELTRTAILKDIYKAKAEFYREDPWFNNNFLTTLSGNGQYYTNSVVDYSITGRAYLQPWETPFRGRLIGELGWQDASENFPNADPFFTQNNYFLKGAGFDLRYRNPNNFEYDSLIELELMGKHAASDGYFFTGRVNLEHKFKKFWQIKVGSEFSTSSVYQSNRIFFTISHFFRHKLKHPKQR